MEAFAPLIMLVLMFGIMYFLMIRPENKRKKEAEEMRNNIQKGDQIITIGGIVGRVVSVNENSIVIETSDDRVRMELLKWSVSSNETRKPMDKKAQKKAAKEAKAKEEAAKLEENTDSKAE